MAFLAKNGPSGAGFSPKSAIFGASVAAPPFFQILLTPEGRMSSSYKPFLAIERFRPEGPAKRDPRGGPRTRFYMLNKTPGAAGPPSGAGGWPLCAHLR